MCLIAVDWRPQNRKGEFDPIADPSNCPALLLVANRDEYYRRPSQSAQFWRPGDPRDGNGGNDTTDDNSSWDDQVLSRQDPGFIYAGKDLTQGGTWLACSAGGRRFSTITNFHTKEDNVRSFPRSRGEIVSIFVAGRHHAGGTMIGEGLPNDWSAKEFVDEYLIDKLNEYAGFSVLLFDGSTLACCSNRGDTQLGGECFRELPAGLYGLSNHSLDTPWPKVKKAKESIAAARRTLSNTSKLYQGELDEGVMEQLLTDFGDTTVVNDELFNVSTLNGDELYIRCCVCVRLKGYGTRTTTVVCYDEQTGFEFIEKNYDTSFDKASLSRETISNKQRNNSPGGKTYRRLNDRNKSLVDHNWKSDTTD
jgi:uncharacterized protein with NRDE domain